MKRELQRANGSGRLALIVMSNGPRRCSPSWFWCRRCRNLPPLSGSGYRTIGPVLSQAGLFCI